MKELVRLRYFVLPLLTAIQLSAQPGTITTAIGAFPLGDGLPAQRSSLLLNSSITIDSEGRLLINEASRIRRVELDGRMSTFLGNGIFGFLPIPPSGPFTIRRENPIGVNRISSHPGGDLLGAVSLSYYCMFPDTFPSGIFWRFGLPETMQLLLGANPCLNRNLGDGGRAAAAWTSLIQYFTVDLEGRIYFSDFVLNRVRRIELDGTIQAFAGSGAAGFSGDGDQAAKAALRSPWGLSVSADHDVYIADFGNSRIRKVAADGKISTFATWAGVRYVLVSKTGGLLASDGNSIRRYPSPDAPPVLIYVASSRNRGFIRDIIEDRDGSILIADDFQVYRLNADGSDAGYVAGVEATAGSSGPPEFARAIYPQKTFTDPSGRIWFSDYLGLHRQKEDRSIETLVTGFSSFAVAPDSTVYLLSANRIDRWIDGRRTVFVAAEKLNSTDLADIAVNSAGELLVVDRQNHKILKVGADGVPKVIAGTGRAVNSGDGGQATAAELNSPQAIAVGLDDSIYIGARSAIRRIFPDGKISTVAGGTNTCQPMETGTASKYGNCFYSSVAVDRRGDVYFTTASGSVDNGIYRVRGDNFVRVAGKNLWGFDGDGGPASLSFLFQPRGISFAPNGDLIFADSSNHRIRRIQGFSPFTFNPDRVSFAASLGGPDRQDRVQLSSADGEPHNFRVEISYPAGRTSWLKISPPIGQVTRDSPVNLQFTASPQGLPKGIYSARVTLIETQSQEFTELPVTLLVSGTAQQLRLAQTGFTFVAGQDGPAPPAQPLTLQNSGTGSLAFTVQASTLAGGAWLSVTPIGGAADAATQPVLAVQVNPAGLAPGVYFGLITVNSTVADNAPQSAVVLLQVLATGQSPLPIVDPAGLIFTSSNLQTITLGNVRSSAITYTVAAPTFPDRRVWFQLPQTIMTGSILPGQTARIDIRPQIADTPPGQYRAQLSIRFAPDNITRVVELLLVVSTSGNPNAKGREAGACKSRPRVNKSAGNSRR